MTSEAVIAKGDDFTSRTTFHSGHRFNSLLELARFGANIAAQCDVPSSFAYGQLALCGPDTQPACETPVVGWFGASHRPQKTQGQLQYANLQPGNMLASQADAADVLAAFNAKNDRQLDQLKRDVQETQSSEQPTEPEPESEPESAVVNSTEDLLRILRMDKSQLQAEQTDMVDRYRHRMPRRRQDQEQHPLVDILNGMAEGCPAASFVIGIIPDVREGVQDSDRQPIFVPIAFYNSRNDANVLLAAIRDRVPRLGMSLYVLPPGQLYVPARIDEVALSVHSASPEIDKMLTEARHRRPHRRPDRAVGPAQARVRPVCEPAAAKPAGGGDGAAEDARRAARLRRRDWAGL